MSDEIKILFTGDLCPHGRVEDLALNGRFDEVFNDFIEEFRNNDLNVVDLECPLTEIKDGRPKTGPHQKAHPQTLGLLSHAGIGLACMANNHIMDYGSRGAEQTIDLLEAAGIATLGIGRNAAEARNTFSMDIKGRRIAILNFADNEFLTAPGSDVQCNPIHPVHNYEDITTAKKDHDFVILNVHGGNEFYHLPSPRTKALYRHYVNIGADAVVSQHTHAYSGYEIYNEKPIFYGLGNFIYDWPGKANSSWNRGYVVRLNITDKIDFEIIPLEQCNENPGVFYLDEAEKEASFNRINELIALFVDDELLEGDFIKFCEKVLPMYDAFIEPYFGKVITALKKRGLFPRFMGRKKRLFLLNLSRCESHKEVLHYLLKKNE